MKSFADVKPMFNALFDAAIRAADPQHLISVGVVEKPKGRIIVVGAGKASAQMALAFERAWGGPIEGTVVTQYGAGVACKYIEILESAHPVPDRAGEVAATKLLDLVQGLSADDLVVALISGGGSSLLPAPPTGLTLADEIATNQVLLASGAPISAMNVIRKHMSQIKGGRLAAAAHPAKVVSLIISDIPGDNPAFVASGPTVPDESSRADALRTVAQFALKLPESVMAHLNDPRADAPGPADPRFVGNSIKIIASARQSLRAAAAVAEENGFAAVITSDAIEGEAREVGAEMAAQVKKIQAENGVLTKPIVLLSGGETTVTLRDNGANKGRGGRNTEFLLAFAQNIDGCEGIYGFAADTDGIDGSENNAGAFADGTTAQRLRACGRIADDYLRNHECWAAFDALDDLFVSGPTGTNVNDFRVILINR